MLAGAAVTVDCAAVGVPGRERRPSAGLGDRDAVGGVGRGVGGGLGNGVLDRERRLTPEPLVVPETVVIVEEPPPFASVTVLPGTGFEFASRNVTVTVAVVTPFADHRRGGGSSRLESSGARRARP